MEASFWRQPLQCPTKESQGTPSSVCDKNPSLRNGELVLSRIFPWISLLQWCNGRNMRTLLEFHSTNSVVVGMLWTTFSGSNLHPFFLWKDNGPIAVPCGTSSVGLNLTENLLQKILALLKSMAKLPLQWASGFIPASAVEAQFLPTVDLAPVFDTAS